MTAVPQNVPQQASQPIEPPPSTLTKPPRPVPQPDCDRATIFAFPPNREILGGTAYCILSDQGNILIDCPAWTPATETWLADRGGVRWLVLTHRDGIAKVREIQASTRCEIIIQEQEAYLLPNLTVTTFHDRFQLNPDTEILWTCGYSPGASCIYTTAQGGVLFTGRHILPDRTGHPTPLRISKTFHWKRQLKNVQTLRDRFTSDTLKWICPGANTGYLRGATAMDDAYTKLGTLNLEILQNTALGV